MGEIREIQQEMLRKIQFEVMELRVVVECIEATLDQMHEDVRKLELDIRSFKLASGGYDDYLLHRP